MTIAIVARGNANSTPFGSSTTATTATGQTTAASGSKFAICVNAKSQNVSSVSDSQGNTYALKQKGTGFNSASIYLCESGTGGANHTATVTMAAADSFSFFFVEVTGAAATSYDAGGTASDMNADTAVNGASVITTNATDLILSFLGCYGDSGGITDSGTGFSILDSITSGGVPNAAISTRATSATGTYNDSYAMTSGIYTALATIALKQLSVSTNQYVEDSRRSRPGRGPFSKAQFRVSDTAAYTATNSDVTVGLTGQAATFAAGSVFGSISRIYTDDPARARPGRGPFSRGKFYVSDNTAQSAPSGNVTVALTGQAATLGAGTLSSATAVAANGQSAIFSLGAVLAASQIVVSGQSATTSAGSLTGSSQVALTGQSGASTAGTVIPGLQVTLVGQAASFASGALALGSTVVLIGQPASFTPGNLVASGGGNVTLALTGQLAAFASGALLPSSSAVLTGQAITSAVGLVGPARSLAFTGQAATFTAGNLLASSAVGVTGQSGSFTAGVVTPPNGVTTSLTGQAASFASGSFTQSVTVGLTGQSIASSAGTLAAANAQALAGSAITSASGTLLGSFTVALAGQPGTFTSGLVLPPSDKTASLTGSVATFRAGTVLAIGAVLTGTPRYVVRRSQKRIFTVSAVTYSQFPPKDPAEAVKLEFDFADDLDSGVLLSGTPVVTVTVSGADPTPTGIFNGLPRFDTTSTQVIVPVVGGVANCDYDVKVVVPTTDSLTVLALNGILPVRA